VKTVPVVVAAVDVPRGSVISSDHVAIQQWPKALMPNGSMEQIENALNRSVMVPLVKGEPILDGKLAAKDAGRGLAALIPQGLRAFTIATPKIQAGVGGFILPGNRVDVLLTTTSSGSDDPTGGGATTTLLQNVEVLAVAQRLDAPDSNRINPDELKSVTLLVTPDQAAKLDLGMNKGTLHLSLRHPEDHLEADTQPATMAQLRFHQEKPLVTTDAAAATPDETPAAGRQNSQVSQIQTLRGLHRGVIRVERSK